jgi:hypothetical protein
MLLLQGRDIRRSSTAAAPVHCQCSAHHHNYNQCSTAFSDWHIPCPLLARRRNVMPAGDLVAARPRPTRLVDVRAGSRTSANVCARQSGLCLRAVSTQCSCLQHAGM